jgi:beta-galactosidase
MEGIPINVWVYTNCEELELFLNGTSFGKKVIEKYGHGEWDVPYEKGELTVVGYIAGKEVIRQSRVTSGQAKALQLKMETPVTESCGNNIALIKCYCTDEEGRYVPDAAPYVSFEVASDEGSVIATGSSSSDHIPPSSTKRQMFLGEIRVGVKPKENAEELWLYASAPGLKKAVLRIPFISGNISGDSERKSNETGGHIAN